MVKHKTITSFICIIILAIVGIVGITTIVQGLHELKHIRDIQWSETCFIGYSKTLHSFAWATGDLQNKSIFELEFQAYIITLVTFGLIFISFIFLMSLLD